MARCRDCLTAAAGGLARPDAFPCQLPEQAYNTGLTVDRMSSLWLRDGRSFLNGNISHT
jgi:hypothetical protein